MVTRKTKRTETTHTHIYADGKRVINIIDLAFADDVQICVETKPELNRVLETIDAWCTKWRMSINSTKTKILAICDRPRKYEFKFRGKPLEVVDQQSTLA